MRLMYNTAMPNGLADRFDSFWSDQERCYDCAGQPSNRMCCDVHRRVIEALMMEFAQVETSKDAVLAARLEASLKLAERKRG